MDIDSWLDYKFKNLEQKIASLKQSIHKDTIDINISNPNTRSSNGETASISPSELVIQLALDGIVYNEEKAERGECKCVPLPTGKNLCWAKGIIGALSQDQVKKYCRPETTVVETGAKIPKHVEKFIEASEECKIGKTFDSKKIKTLEDRLICMHQKLEED